MDKILINDLILETRIAIDSTDIPQQRKIRINVEIYEDFSKAKASDNIADTIDYHLMRDRIVEYISQGDDYNLEDLTNKIIDMFHKFGADQIQVRVDINLADDFTETVGLRLKRSKTSST